jgi:Ankyrin repeats (3 copies)
MTRKMITTVQHPIAQRKEPQQGLLNDPNMSDVRSDSNIENHDYCGNKCTDTTNHSGNQQCLYNDGTVDSGHEEVVDDDDSEIAEEGEIEVEDSDLDLGIVARNFYNLILDNNRLREHVSDSEEEEEDGIDVIMILYYLVFDGDYDENGYERFADFLAEHSAMVDDKDVSSMLMAACYGNRDTLKVNLLLTRYGAARTINVIHHKYTALHYAVGLNLYVGVHDVYIRRHHCLRRRCDWQRYRRTMEIATLLVLNGADVNAKSRCAIGMTPFHLAIINCMAMVKQFFKHVKDINVCDNNGHTPLYWAITNANLSAVALLLSHPNIDLSKQRRKWQFSFRFSDTNFN